MQARHLLSLALALIAGAGCSPDSQPTEPGSPAAPVDMSGAFQLTIDVATGRVTVSPPRSSAAVMRPGPGSLANSVVGSEVIALQAGNCTFSNISGNPKQKRCSMQLAIENRLDLADLVTPTTFPRPPQGGGLLVFPYTAAALGVPGGGAVPNTLWDQAPTNFFNDFAGCSAKSSDCYRWERYPSPLAAGETSAARTVGFDVDKAAQSVSMYILVAADVRDAEPKRLSLTPVASGCGTLGTSGGSDDWSEGELRAGNGFSDEAFGLCTFQLPALLEEKNIVSATLTFHQVSMSNEFVQENGRVIAQLVSFAVPPVDDGFNVVTVLDDDLGVLTDSPEPGPRSLDVLLTILTELVGDRTRIQIRLDATGMGVTRFAGITGGATDPSLTVLYRER